MSFQYSSEQQEAIDLCCDQSNRIACVTGQAGTGKTTILKEAFNGFINDLGISAEDIVLAAPTGRAAKRIEEATGIEACTIHKLLKFSMPEEKGGASGLPLYTKLYTLPFRVVLIDEASMVDTVLWRNLIDALSKKALIRFFGDINQLPPVELGMPKQKSSPFGEALKKFPSALLTHNYRSDDGIIKVSDRIIQGKMPMINAQVDIFRLKSIETMQHVRQLADKHDFTQMNKQIIVPTQRTKYGCDVINTFIQQRYNPEKDKIHVYRTVNYATEIRTFKRGDKVLWSENNYDLNIMNGTLGYVRDFDAIAGTIVCSFDGQDIVIPPQLESFHPYSGLRKKYDPRTSLSLGYAITTHKSQGSQFETVLYVLAGSRAASRENLYTAVTRAQSKLIILNIGGTLARAVLSKSV